MERHIKALLRRISFLFIFFGTLILYLLFAQPPSHCLHQTLTPFPKSSCDSNRRHPLSQSLHSSRPFRHLLSSYTNYFRHHLLPLNLLSNASKVLCVSAGFGHEVMALTEIGVDDVTGVEIFDSPPLVKRADPHHLPFFDGIFDLAFSSHLGDALYPSRFVGEMERTVRIGGICVVVVDGYGDKKMVRRVRGLFRRSGFVGVWKVSLLGSEMTQVVMRVGRS